MQYRLIDHHQHALTSAYLFDLYEITNDTPGESIYCCLPNGALGVTVVLNGVSHIDIDGIWVEQPDVSVYGLITQRQFIKMSPNYRELTIGFSPHIFQLCIKYSMSLLLRHNSTDLNHLLPGHIVEALHDALRTATTDREILDSIAAFISSLIGESRVDDRLVAAHKLIYSSQVQSVNDLSNALNLSTAGLRLLFRDKVGISPKEAIKIARIRKALNYTIKSEENLTKLAYDLNYFDQSPFIRDFREAMGMSPKQYFKNKDLTFDFYNFSRLRLSSFADRP